MSTPAPQPSRCEQARGGCSPKRARNFANTDKLLADFTCDPLSGLVFKDGVCVGTPCWGGYLRVFAYGRTYMAHRLVWLLSYGKWPEQNIDHINGVRDDNRLANLRDVSQAMNCQNKAAALPTNRTTGLLGTNYHSSNGKGRFRAQIWCGGKNIHVGYFNTPEEAHAAYLKAKAERHPGFLPERFA